MSGTPPVSNYWRWSRWRCWRRRRYRSYREKAPPLSGPRPSIGGAPNLNTARGAIDTTDLGVTLMHEHVFLMTTEILQNYPEAWGDESKRVADAIVRLNELKSRGVDTIVDLTVVGLGRYIPRIARIAAETDLNIVVATGLYT